MNNIITLSFSGEEQYSIFNLNRNVWEEGSKTTEIDLSPIIISEELPVLNSMESIVQSFAKLKDGWNGPSSVRVSEKTIKKAISFSYLLPFRFDVFPTGRNSVQFEYETKKEYIEFEIFENSYSYLKEDYVTDKTEERTFDLVDLDKILEKYKTTDVA